MEFARAKAHRDNTSLGRAVSDLAFLGVEASRVTGVGHGLVKQAGGLVTLVPGIGRSLTDEQVAEALERDELREAGLDA